MRAADQQQHRTAVLPLARWLPKATDDGRRGDDAARAGRPMSDHPPQHIVAVMGVVTNANDRLLLVRTHLRGWEPPGGQVERGEELIEALRREIAEESGCAVEVGRLVGVYSNVAAPEKLMFTFLCRHLAGEPTPSAETPEVGWFTTEEALRLVTFPPQHDKLRDALAAAPGVVYRAYRTHPYVVLSEHLC
jgi:8-oxo-dGTP diphosphatase